MKSFFLLLGLAGLAAAQPTVCSTTSAPLVVRAEGLTERVGDILYSCTGAPNAAQTITLSVQLNTPITNRLSSAGAVTGTILTVDSGSGPQATLVQPTLLSENVLTWTGVPIAFSSQGTLSIRIQDLRANATVVPVGSGITALLGGSISISQSSLLVATPETSLYDGFSGRLICAQTGSPVPANLTSFSSLIQQGTAFTSTRITEGFAGAFPPKSAPASLNADTGTRFLVVYSGFPQAASLFVPNVIAGSDAVQPTAGGDLGVTASGGAYAPSANGSLLLALVPGADSTGAGGSPIYTPGALGSGTVTFDAVTQLTLNNGVAYAVYEVVDSNPLTLETAQFPTFLGLAANVVQTAVATAETVTYAPVSTVGIANATSPIPRFEATTPPNDCGVIGDCGASYFPQLTVATASLQFSLNVGGPNQVQGIPVTNSGAGVLAWTASVSYTSGSGWLTMNPVSGINNGTINVYANPGSLPAGTYQATVTVDAGSAGRRIIAVTLTLSVATNPGPQVVTVENGADFLQVPVVPGSIATILGTALTGSSVSATFNGQPATILYSSAQQINLVVPTGLPSSAQLVVAVNGQLSAPVNVTIAPFEPGIFSGALLNQDSTPNSVTNGAGAGSVVYFYATGLSGTGTISARVGSTELTNLYYAGPAPGYPGVQQINLVVPSGLGAGTVNLYACGTSAGGEVCSPPVPLVLK